jgi:hypothetical protein
VRGRPRLPEGEPGNRAPGPAKLAPAYFLLSKIFFSTFFGSGPVVHSGGEGRTGGGGPGGLGVQGGFGIFIPRFLSLGAFCRRLLPMEISFAGIYPTLRPGARDRFNMRWPEHPWCGSASDAGTPLIIVRPTHPP